MLIIAVSAKKKVFNGNAFLAKARLIDHIRLALLQLAYTT